MCVVCTCMCMCVIKHSLFQQLLQCTLEAYGALKSLSILQLPARRTLQAYTGCFLHDSGASWGSISKQVEQFKSTCKATGKLVPMADGTLYQLFDKDKAAEQTAYITQFLWRDSMSFYDIRTVVGPYYTNSETFSAKTIHACVFETIHLFQICSSTVLL